MLSVLFAVLMQPQHLPEMTVHAPRAVLTLQIAKTQEQQEMGLMYVTKMKAHEGMIFMFDSDQIQVFWMKNTLVPLDMVFVGADGVVRKVFENVPVVSVATRDDLIPRRSARAQYVIELPAGEATKDGITSGTLLRDVTKP